MIEELEWEQPFLAALAATGIVKHAAKAAGVGYNTAYGRRRTNAGFARRWAEALPPEAERKAAIARTKLAGAGNPPSNWRMLFLDALAETSNVTASAERAGATTAMAYKARRDEPAFANQWRAALREGYDNLEIELLGHLRDPQSERKMDVAAAVRLLAAHRATVERQRALEEEEDVEVVRASIDRFIDAIRVTRAANAPLMIEAPAEDGRADDEE
jgi:hypothetical protein